MSIFLATNGQKCPLAIIKRYACFRSLGTAIPRASREFRNTLAVYLKKKRGITCKPEQIIVTSGTEQSILIAAQAFA